MAHDPDLAALYVYKPYEGCLAGWPSPEQAMAIAKEKAIKLMGGHAPIYVIAPETFSDHPAVKKGMQPPTIHRWCHIARFEGGPLKEDEDGSWLTVIWFAPTPSGDPREILEGISWEEHAKGWTF